jgi:hypothetical protein
MRTKRVHFFIYCTHIVYHKAIFCLVGIFFNYFLPCDKYGNGAYPVVGFSDNESMLSTHLL